jgi:vancomycin resistance protein YoaR
MRSGSSLGLSRSRGAAADPVQGKSARRFAVGFFVAIFLLLGGLYAAGYALTSDRVPQQVSVSGVDIGGLRPGEAQARLRAQLAPRAGRVVVAEYGDKTYQVDPLHAGLRLDVAGTVREAGGGRSLNPLRMIEVLVGGDDIAPVVDVDGAALDAAVGDVAEQVERAPVEGAVHFTNGRPVPVYPTPGLTLDEQATKTALEQSFLDEDPTFDLPVQQVHTDVTAGDVDAAVARFAEPAMSASVVVHVPGGRARLTPRRIGAALSMEARHGRLVPVFDDEALAAVSAVPFDPLTKDPKPATVVLSKGRPAVAKGVPGTHVPPQALARKLLSVLREHGSARSVAVRLRPLPPEFGVDDARNLGVSKVVSRFTTSFPHSRHRDTNIGRAAALVNGTLLKPGDVFSLNKTVGKRTAKNGFEKGSASDRGQLVEDVSQVATTTYNAAFFAGLEDVEHHPHSVYLDRYPMGREAAVSSGSRDLRFKNDTPYGVLIRAWTTPGTPSTYGRMHVQMWSSRYWTIKAGLSEQLDITDPRVRDDTTGKCVEQDGQRGFAVDVFRYFYRDGERVRTEKKHVTYDPVDTVHCRPAPKPARHAGRTGRR